MPVITRSLSPALGAEVCDVDLRRDLNRDTIESILEAWKENLVLLFRNQVLSDEDQLRVGRYFGHLHQRTRPKETRPDGSAQNPEIMFISNIRSNGKLIGALPDGEVHFHSDNCYIERPPKATLLYAMEVPSQGGDTQFLNMYLAYDALDRELKKAIEGRKAMNVFRYGSATRETNAPDFAMDPHYAHPVVRTHPDTGRKALYINRLMTWAIEEMDDTEGQVLLNALFEHIEQPRFTYSHKWRVGDLVLWDNRCTLHARTDFSDKERRLLRRVTIQGDVPV